MLARKFYAQRYSGGSNGVNKAAITPSTSNRLNRIKKNLNSATYAPSFKRVPDNTQGEYITEKRIKQHICNGDTNVEPVTRTCANSNKSGVGKAKICNVTKDLQFQSQGKYVETSLPAKCVLNQTKKDMINNVC